MKAYEKIIINNDSQAHFFFFLVSFGRRGLDSSFGFGNVICSDISIGTYLKLIKLFFKVFELSCTPFSLRIRSVYRAYPIYSYK